MRRREEADIQAIIQDIANQYPTHFLRGTTWGTRADVVVNKGHKSIAIELKSRPITLLDIRGLLRKRYSEKIIATTSDALADTSMSVLDYAERANIHLCNIDMLPELIDRL